MHPQPMGCSASALQNGTQHKSTKAHTPEVQAYVRFTQGKDRSYLAITLTPIQASLSTPGEPPPQRLLPLLPEACASLAHANTSQWPHRKRTWAERQLCTCYALRRHWGTFRRPPSAGACARRSQKAQPPNQPAPQRACTHPHATARTAAGTCAIHARFGSAVKGA